MQGIKLHCNPPQLQMLILTYGAKCDFDKIGQTRIICLLL